jgi:hypothetical protein
MIRQWPLWIRALFPKPSFALIARVNVVMTDEQVWDIVILLAIMYVALIVPFNAAFNL